MTERKRMPLKAAIPVALEVWNKLTDKREKDALESVIFQCVRQVQHTEKRRKSGAQKLYYQEHREEILEKQKITRLKSQKK